MKVYVYPADTHGCGHYRLIWPAQVLRAAGHDVTVVWPNSRGAFLSATLNARDEVVDAYVPPDADVIVLQRVSHRHVTDAVPLIRRKGVAVVVDVDDDLAMIHPDNPAFYAFHPSRPPFEHSWRNVVKTCQNATYVTVSTNALLRHYAPHRRGVILKNYVPARYLDVKHTDSDVIGWGGSIRSHPNDLQVMGTAIQRLLRDGHTFRVVGPVDGVAKRLNLSDTVMGNLEYTGTLDLTSDWPNGLASLGIGVAPLAKTRFNDAKSHLKMLEMAALGVPCVVTPSREYAALHREGIGLTAETPNAWFKRLRGLVHDESQRVELSERGRDVARRWTIEDNAWRWLETWSTALELERGRST